MFGVLLSFTSCSPLLEMRACVTFLFLAVFCLPACTPLLIGTTAATVAVTSIQDKGTGEVIDDKAILSRVSGVISSKDFCKDLTVSVNEGSVLIYGSVRNSTDRVAASKLVWSQEGVREVINEIQVQDKEESFAESAWIAAQIKLALLVKSSVKSFSYTVEVIDGTVYLLGVAQSKEEFSRVYDIARRIEGVKEVVSYVRLKSATGTSLQLHKR
ncbi:putative osmotically inducible protein [Neorickettsia risticii str. Illinois]|uniref:Osmotically inducible protein n=1 Tax=Neorickettsia risticii (strain Illinois) TaxID=434131 RepID=C6V3T5_NEORI|nr:putative osmotically inducible protein [Neorickettsia risticii str. Illinois]